LDPLTLLATFSLIMAVGVLSDLLFRKTLIPDTLPLIFLGILLGPLLRLFPPRNLQPFLPVLGSLTLIAILLEQGMKLSYSRVLRDAPRAVLLALSTFLFSTLFLGFLSHLLLGFPLVSSFMLGAALGGTSSIIVVPLVERLRLPPKVRTVVLLDSVITDVLCIVVVLVLCTLGRATLPEVGRRLALVFFSAFGLGTVMGILWLPPLSRLKEKSHYGVLLAMAIALYVLTEKMGASGGVAVLAFGLVLGNAPGLGRVFKIRTAPLAPEVRSFYGEIAFLLRAFFLFSLGVMLDRGILRLLPHSLLLFLAAVAARMASAKVTGLGDPQLRENGRLIGLLLPKGLAAAVLAYLPLQYGFEGTEVFPQLVLCLILLTNLLSALALRGKLPKN